MAYDSSNKIWEPVAQGLQALGDATVNAISKVGQAAGAGLGALLAMIPGMSGLGEALGAAAARGGESDEPRAAATPVIAKAPAVEIEAPVRVQAKSPSEMLAAVTAAIPANVREQVGNIVQGLVNAPTSFQEVYASAQNPSEGLVLSNLARANTPAVSMPQLGGARGMA